MFAKTKKQLGKKRRHSTAISDLPQQRKRRRIGDESGGLGPADSFIPHMSIEKARELEKNDLIDHRDKVGMYLEARIIDKKGTNCLIHYIDYDTKYDVWSDFENELHRFAEYESISKRKHHRLQHLKEGSLVYFNPVHMKGVSKGWKLGEISGFNRDQNQIKVTFEFNKKYKTYWTHRDNVNEVQERHVLKDFGQRRRPKPPLNTIEEESNEDSDLDRNENVKPMEIANETPGGNDGIFYVSDAPQSQSEDVLIRVIPLRSKQALNENQNETDDDEERKDNEGTLLNENENSNNYKESNYQRMPRNEVKSECDQNLQQMSAREVGNSNNCQESNHQNEIKTEYDQKPQQKKTKRPKKIKSEDGSCTNCDLNGCKVLTSEEVVTWLNGIQNGKYLDAKYKKLKKSIRALDINIFRISSINALFLKDKGIQNAEDINRILSHIQTLIKEQSSKLLEYRKNEHYFGR